MRPDEEEDQAANLRLGGRSDSTNPLMFVPEPVWRPIVGESSAELSLVLSVYQRWSLRFVESPAGRPPGGFYPGWMSARRAAARGVKANVLFFRLRAIAKSAVVELDFVRPSISSSVRSRSQLTSEHPKLLVRARWRVIPRGARRA